MDRYAKMRALACRFWGVPPWELDEAIADGKVLMEDVVDLALLLTNDPTQIFLLQWIYPEEFERRKEAQRALKAELSYTHGLSFLKPKRVEYLQEDGTYGPTPPPEVKTSEC